MAARYPDDEERLEAREGTAAHDYLASVLNGKPLKVGDLAHNGHPITQEMVDGAAALLADVERWRFDTAGQFVIEQRVDMPTIHPTLNWGTCDIGGADLSRKILYLRDYKYGHRYVDAWENWQLVDYGVGLARHFGITITSEWRVDFGIFQPRSFHPDGPKKIWPASGMRFIELADDLAYAARKTVEPDPEYRVGKYCEDCSARFHCPALWDAGGAAAAQSTRGLPLDMTTEQAAGALRHIHASIKRLEALQSGVEAELMGALNAGKKVPFFGVGFSDAREIWTADYNDVVAMGDAFGKNLRKPPEPITPVQARNLGIDATVISEYSIKPTGKKKLVPVDEKQAAKVFK
jgi:hypothetical protein